MLENMKDAAHDTEHIYRVLYTAMDIAAQEKAVDYDVLIAACLLHDIGRQEQFEDPTLCHAAVGAEKAYGYLVDHGFGETYAERIYDGFLTERGKEIALERQAAAVRFYEDMLREVRDSREKGQELLVGHLEA